MSVQSRRQYNQRGKPCPSSYPSFPSLLLSFFSLSLPLSFMLSPSLTPSSSSSSSCSPPSLLSASCPILSLPSSYHSHFTTLSPSLSSLPFSSRPSSPLTIALTSSLYLHHFIRNGA